jgi:hypothetical protein
MPEQIGVPDQIAKLNSGQDAMDQVRRDAEDERKTPFEKFMEYRTNAERKLGVPKGTRINLPNAAVSAALAMLAAAGAPKPTFKSEQIGYPGGSYWVDTVVFAKPLYPQVTLQSDLTELALSPEVVIAELKAAGIIRQ